MPFADLLRSHLPHRRSPPGFVDALRDVVGPLDSLVDIGERFDMLAGRHIQDVPSIADGNRRRPWLLVAVPPEPNAGRPGLCAIEVLALIEQLEVDEATLSLPSPKTA